MTRCNPYSNYAQRQRRPFDPNELSAIDAVRLRTNRLKRAADSTTAAQNKAAVAETMRETATNKWIDNTASVTRVFPEQNKRLQDFLVSMFGQKARALGLDPQRNYSLAGEVRFNLESFQQAAEGLVNIAGRIQSLERIKEYDSVLKSVTEDKGLMSQQIERLSTDAREIGQIPRKLSNEMDYRINVMGNVQSPLVKFQKRRYDRFVQQSTDLGLSNDEINDLINASADLSTVFDEVKAVGQSVGVHVPTLENLGYFARIITDDFRLRMRDIDIPELFEQIQAGTVDLSTIFSRSRKTVHYIPADLQVASQIMGVSPQILETLLDNPTEFRAYLHENLSASQLDTLVDTGVFEKLPMASTEVFDYFVKQYELPYKSISQMFELDPTIAVQKYTNSLQQAAGNSSMIRGILDGRAFAAGWTVGRDIIDTDPALYANFVPLGDYLDKWAASAKITPGQALMRMGLVGDEFAANSMMVTLKDAYVHPVVAAQWSAIMDVSMSPAMMSQMAGLLANVNKITNKLLISANPVVYTANNLFSSTIQTVAAGGNISRFLPNFYDVLRALTGGTDIFDDARPYVTSYGEELTRKQMVDKFLINRGQQFAPGTFKIPYTFKSQNISEFAKSVFNTPAAFTQALGDIMTYTMAKGNVVNGKTIPIWERPGRMSKATIQKMISGLESGFGGLVYFSNLIEIAAKLTVLDTIMQKVNPLDEAKSIMAQTMTSFQFTRFDNLDEAFRHLDEYFVNGFGTGSVTARVSGFIKPFATWAMANPPMQVRHMLRHPQWYMSYHRLHAMNQDDMSQDERAIEAAIEPWLLDAYPWYIGKDREGKPMVVSPLTFDPIADAFVFFKEGSENIERSLGLKNVGSAAEQRKAARNETTADFLNSQVGQTFPLVRGLYEFISGIDTFTGQRVDDNPAEGYPDFLGVNLPPRLVLLAQKIPVLNTVDRLNPFGALGRSAKIDNLTGQVKEPGRPSIFGGQRTRNDTRGSTFETSPLWAQTLMLAGLNIRTVDYDRNLQNTFGDIETTVNYMEKSINDNRVAIEIGVQKGTVNRAEYERRANVIRTQTATWGQLLIDQMRLHSYMKRFNVTPKSILRELDKKNIQVRNLPLPGDEQLKDIARKVFEVNNDLNRIEAELKQ